MSFPLCLKFLPYFFSLVKIFWYLTLANAQYWYITIHRNWWVNTWASTLHVIHGWRKRKHYQDCVILFAQHANLLETLAKLKVQKVTDTIDLIMRRFTFTTGLRSVLYPRDKFFCIGIQVAVNLQNRGKDKERIEVHLQHQQQKMKYLILNLHLGNLHCTIVKATGVYWSYWNSVKCSWFVGYKIPQPAFQVNLVVKQCFSTFPMTLNC